jgi:dTDP-glucose pyrophosphorylase
LTNTAESWAVIPAAGLGSQLQPHTHTTPKPLLHVAGKPILEHSLVGANAVVEAGPRKLNVGDSSEVSLY